MFHITMVLAAALLLAACGAPPAAAPQEPGPAAGMCAPDTPDCVDTVVDPGGDGGDDFDSEAARVDAEGLLGRAEDELAPDVRIGRRGDEHMALTEDYVLGRRTVELEADDAGAYRVVAVTVELPEGPETLR